MRRVGEYPLWIGTARDARDLRAVLDAGIEAVIDLAVNEPPAVLTRELAYLRFPLLDGPGNPPGLVRAAVAALAELVRSRTPTLVACGFGLSRSPCVVAAAVAAVEGRTLASVLPTLPGPCDVSPGMVKDVIDCLERN